MAKVKGLVEASIDGTSQREDASKIREGAGGNVWKGFLGWARGEERVDCECGKEGKLRRGSYSNRRHFGFFRGADAIGEQVVEKEDGGEVCCMLA